MLVFEVTEQVSYVYSFEAKASMCKTLHVGAYVCVCHEWVYMCVYVLNLCDYIIWIWRFVYDIVCMYVCMYVCVSALHVSEIFKCLGTYTSAYISMLKIICEC